MWGRCGGGYRGDGGERWGRDGSVDPLRGIDVWEMRTEGEIARAHLHGRDLEEIWASLWRAARSGGDRHSPESRRELTREWPRSGAVVRSGNDFDLIVNTLAAVFIVDIPALAYKALLRHFRDASETRPRHVRDTSEAL